MGISDFFLSDFHAENGKRGVVLFDGGDGFRETQASIIEGIQIYRREGSFDAFHE